MEFSKHASWNYIHNVIEVSEMTRQEKTKNQKVKVSKRIFFFKLCFSFQATYQKAKFYKRAFSCYRLEMRVQFVSVIGALSRKPASSLCWEL